MKESIILKIFEMRRREKRAIKSIFAFFVISFLAFWVISVTFGGDAVNGKIEDGRYYFGSHGEYTEVSRTAYVASASFVMILCAIISFFLLFVFYLMIKGGISLKDFKESLSNLLIFLPLLIGCGFLVGTFQSLMCILRAFGII